MPELDHHDENESRYSCSCCEETGIDIESREYCSCELGKRRMNLDRLADPLRHHPFTNAMWVAHHSAMKTERAIAAAELALLKSKLIQAERRAAQPVVLSDEQKRQLVKCLHGGINMGWIEEEFALELGATILAFAAKEQTNE